MPSYVDQYVRLDKRAADAEGHADQYRARADENRWEQCRIVYEAIESGEYSGASFGRAVGRNGSTINNQRWIWESYGHLHEGRRGRYSDRWAEALGQIPGTRHEANALSGARKVLADPKLAKQVLDDPSIRRAVMSNDRLRRDLTRTAHEVDAHRAAKVARQTRESAPRLAEAREYYEAISRLTHARADVNKALDLLRGLPPLSADEREDVREILGWLSTSVEWAYEAIKARRAATLSDEIESYLQEQTT